MRIGSVPGVTRKLHLEDGNGGLSCYATLNWRDGKPDQLLLSCDKVGSRERGLLHSLADVTTLALRAGVPLQAIADQWKGTRFEPSGVTGNKDYPMVSSILDYLGRWLEHVNAPKVAA